MKKFRFLLPLLLLGYLLCVPLVSFAAPLQPARADQPAASKSPAGVVICDPYVSYNFTQILGNYGTSPSAPHTALCAGGDGFTGLGPNAIFNVSYIAPGNNCGWLRFYATPAAASAGTGQYFLFSPQSSNLMTASAVLYKVTQVDIQSQGIYKVPGSCTPIHP